MQTSGLAEQLAASLNTTLSDHESVIWLVPGGSNIPISVEASKLLDDSLTHKLIIMQTDERFVAPDSPDCNWHQLIQQGLKVGNATAYPILSTDGLDLAATAAAYAETVRREFARTDLIIGQFGFGADGHIAGIKPDSPAATSTEPVAGYQAEDFTRVTLTFETLRRVSRAEVFAYGADKRPVFDKLASPELPPLTDFPVGILREISDFTIYNDYIEA